MAIYFRTPNGNVRQASTIHMNVGNNVGERRIQSIYYGVGGGSTKQIFSGDSIALLNEVYKNIRYLYINVKNIPSNAIYTINAPESKYAILATNINSQNNLYNINIYTKAKKLQIINRKNANFLFWNGVNIPFDKILFDNNCNYFNCTYGNATLSGDLTNFIKDIENKPYYNNFMKSNVFYIAKYDEFSTINLIVNNTINAFYKANFPNTKLNVYYPSTTTKKFNCAEGTWREVYLKIDCNNSYYINFNFFSYNTTIVFNSPQCYLTLYNNCELKGIVGKNTDVNNYIEPHIFYNFKNTKYIDKFGEASIVQEIYTTNDVNYNLKTYYSFISPVAYTWFDNPSYEYVIYNYNNFKYNYFYIYFNNFYFVNRIINKSEYAVIINKKVWWRNYATSGTSYGWPINNIVVTQETFTPVTSPVYRPDDPNHTSPYNGSNKDYGAYRGNTSGIYLLYDYLE